MLAPLRILRPAGARIEIEFDPHPLVSFFSLCRLSRRCHQLDADELIPTRSAWKTTAAQPELLPRLGAWRYRQLHGATERRHRHLGAESGLPWRQGQFDLHVFAREDVQRMRS